MFFQFLEVLIVLFGNCYRLNNFKGFFLTIDWNKVADEGKQDCQINSLVQLLSRNRIKIIEKIDKLKFNDQFNWYDDCKIDNEIKNILRILCKQKNIEYNNMIISQVCVKFKKDLNRFFDKREENIICELSFDDGYKIYKIFEALETINKTAFFLINFNNLMVYSIDETRTHLMLLIFNSNNSKYIGYAPYKIMLNLSKFKELLKCKKIESVLTKLTFKENILCVELQSKNSLNVIQKSTRNFDLSFEDHKELKELINLSYFGSFKLSKSKYNYLISHFGLFTEEIKINLSKNQLVISETFRNDNCQIKWTDKENFNIKSVEQITASTSINLLRKLSKFLIDEKVKLHFFIDFDKPIKIKISFNSIKNLRGFYFLAQRE